MSAVSSNQKCLFTYRVENETLFFEPRGATISLPADAENFSVTSKDGKMEIHAMIDPTFPEISYKFYLRTTGLLLDGNEGDYIGTIALVNGYFIGHLFAAQPSISSQMSTKKVIYKYPLFDGDESKVLLPDSAQKICIFVRRNKPYVYAIVDLNHSLIAHLSL